MDATHTNHATRNAGDAGHNGNAENSGSTRSGAENNGSIRSVDRALDLLTAVCAGEYIETGRSLNDCARAADLPPSTALRFLRSLIQRGFVVRDADGMFHPGTELLRLGAGVLSRNSLIRIATPDMRTLVQDINESVYLVVLDADGDCLYIAIEECSQPIRHASWVGKTIPAERSAAGKALSGAVQPGECAFEHGTVEQDVTAISSPIVVGGKPVAAMSILAPSYRIDDEKTHDFADKLATTTTKVSQYFTDEVDGDLPA